jgi:hypothetical protein
MTSTTNALTGFATGKRQNRPQDVGTPLNILSAVSEAMGCIVLDPCGSRLHPTGAETTYHYPDTDGLKSDWVNGTYCNPPFEDLQKWLAKSAAEKQAGVREQCLLVPVRPRSRWWCDYMHDIPTCIAWLKRVKFVGYLTSYPEALVLAYTGVCVPAFKQEITRANLANLITGPLQEH